MLTDRVVAKKYLERNGALEIPALFVVDRAGILRGVHRSLEGKAGAALEKQVEGLLR
jgi:hypothetical protein